MRRLAALLLAPTLAAGLAFADGPAAKVIADPTPVALRAEQLRRDLGLVTALVDGGLKLAAQDDAAHRAGQCNRLARDVARELRQALGTKDRDRAGDLGHYLQALLARGVAGNLRLARADLPPDSPRHKELRRVLDDALAVARPLRQELDDAGHKDLRHTLDKGHDALQEALPDETPLPSQKPKPAPKAPPAGTKLLPKV